MDITVHNKVLNTTGNVPFRWIYGLLLFSVSALSLNAGPITLGNAGSYSVLAGSAVTNTGPTVVAGDLGVSPESAITGIPPGVVHGTVHSADANALAAQNDALTAYNTAAGLAPTQNLTGQNLGDSRCCRACTNSIRRLS